jgi:hypothetical protein
MHAGQTATAAGPAHVGIMIARQATLVGLRVHITAAPRGVRDAWLPAPAAVHDSQVMPALVRPGTRDRVDIGDGVVHNPTQALMLATRNVVVDALPRRDSAQRAL